MMHFITNTPANKEEDFPVKKTSKKQSRKNIKKRKSKVADRHAKASSWNKQSRPVFGSGTIH
jgi:hypothetical protein